MTKGNLDVEASGSPRICKAIGVFFSGSILGLFRMILSLLVFWFVTIYSPGAETFFVADENH